MVLLLATEDLEVRAVVRPPTGPPFDLPQEHILVFLQYFQQVLKSTNTF